jgi:hypothetical protein
MDGFGTYLPLSLGISLSFGRTGVCLSLLLDGMAVKFLLSLLQKAKKILLGSDTRNDADTLSALRSTSTHRIVLDLL